MTAQQLVEALLDEGVADWFAKKDFGNQGGFLKGFVGGAAEHAVNLATLGGVERADQRLRQQKYAKTSEEHAKYVAAFTDDVAQQLQNKGIQCDVVSPGVIQGDGWTTRTMSQHVGHNGPSWVQRMVFQTQDGEEAGEIDSLQYAQQIDAVAQNLYGGPPVRSGSSA